MCSTVISRKHGQIRLGNNSCFLTDLCSKNGIRVNGVRLGDGQEIELMGGELIQFADIGYYFQKENINYISGVMPYRYGGFCTGSCRFVSA